MYRDLMGASADLVATLVTLVTKPFSLFKLFCIFCLNTALIVINTWIEIIKAGISLQFNILWRLIMWTFALISLPYRILTAIQRERQLETQQDVMKVELENILWDMKEVEGRFLKAVTDRKVMEVMLLELEDEHDKMIEQVELLEKELHGLRKENLRLKETRGKDTWDFKSQGRHATSTNTSQLPFKSNSNRAGTIAHQDLSVKEIAQSDITSTDPSLHQQRELAMKRSLFSAILSFIVGMIVWEARDPCMPLVIALFTVVAMSLKSVVGFFSTVKNKPASDAVALLSLNCFILGTLTYPTLPRAACMLAPLAAKVLDKTVRMLGFPSYLANSTAALDF